MTHQSRLLKQHGDNEVGSCERFGSQLRPDSIGGIVQNNHSKESPQNRSSINLLLIALALIVGGGWLASRIQTDGGNVAIKDLRFVGTSGREISALLYVPRSATKKTPAPGILAIHGYINSRETQDGFAIEFARRGYVVLAPDQAGHGYTDPPAFANGFGGPEAMKFLLSLDIVDKTNVGLEGHSMGGWAVQMAAAAFPNEYRSMLLAGSSTGTFGTPPGTATTPRNLGLIFSKYDEFSQTMWGAPIPRDIVRGKKLQTVFATEQLVEIGKLYGSIEAGTARMLYMPSTTHPQDHISTTAIGDAMDWMQRTLKGGTPLANDDQIWYWKEFGTLLAFIGATLSLFAIIRLLLQSSAFGSLTAAPPANKAERGIAWYMSAALTVAIPIVTYFYFQNLAAKWFPASALLPQTITSGLATWAMLNALLTLVLLCARVLFGRRSGITFANYGLGGAQIFKSFALALTLIGWLGLLLALSDFLFKIDFRFWVVALKLPSLLQTRVMLSYLVPFIFFFVVQGAVLHGQLRRDELSLRREVSLNMLLLSVGFIALLLVQYIPLFGGGVLPLGESLLTIVAWQFVPLMIIIAAVSTYCFRKTGRVYVGAFVNALFVTWYIVAGQATQFAG
jgi:pimeloyl-ACP methyl ester carboxylesterase